MKRGYLGLFIVMALLLSACSRQEEIYRYPAYKLGHEGERWGFIDEEGRFVIEPKYSSLSSFKSSRAIVEKDGLFGLIDQEGREILKTSFSSLGPISGDYIVGYDQAGPRIFNLDGREILLEKDYLSIGPYSHGYFSVSAKTSKNKVQFGYIDKRGRELVSPQYDLAHDFYLGRALVLDSKGYKFIDKKNKTFKRLDKEQVRPSPQEGYYIFKREENYGLINQEGKLIIDAAYSNILSIKDGLVVVESKGGGKGLLKLEGERVLEADYDDIQILNSKLVALSREKGKKLLPLYELLSLEDGLILPGKYYNVSQDDPSIKEGFIGVSDEEKSFFIDLEGRPVERLPLERGFGLMEFDSEVIKSQIDGRLLYYRKNGDIIWEEDRTLHIDGGVQLVAKEIKKEKLRIDYPRILGLEDELQGLINNQIYDCFSKIDSQPVESRDYIYYKSNYKAGLKDDIITLEKNTSYLKNKGKGQVIDKAYYNFNYKNGDFYSLGDIIRPESSLEDLNRLVFEKNALDDSFQPLKTDQGFKIQDGRIYLVMDYWEAAGEKRAYREVYLELKEISNYLATTIKIDI